MNRRVIAAALLAAALAAPAAAQNMPLNSFVQRGTALEKKGPMALFHKGEISALMTEMKGASEAVRAERLAAEKAGRKGVYCPPAKGKGQAMGAQKLLAELRAIPAAQARTMTTTDGMRYVVARHYPCPK